MSNVDLRVLDDEGVTHYGRCRSAWYLAGTAPRQLTLVESVVETIGRFPGATISDIHAWLRSEGITFAQVVTAMQGVSRHRLAQRRGWNPSRWYPQRSAP